MKREMACRIEAKKNSILKSFLPSFHTHRLRKIVNGRIQEQKGMTRKKTPFQRQVRCYVCDSPDHLAHDRKANKSESRKEKLASQN